MEKNLKEEEAFGDWLEKNNPKIAKRLMTKQMEEKKRGKKKIMKTIQEERRRSCIRNSCIDLEEQGAWLIQIKDAGHAVMDQYPEEIGKILQTFLSTTENHPS